MFPEAFLLAERILINTVAFVSFKRWITKVPEISVLGFSTGR